MAILPLYLVAIPVLAIHGYVQIGCVVPTDVSDDRLAVEYKNGLEIQHLIYRHPTTTLGYKD